MWASAADSARQQQPHSRTHRPRTCTLCCTARHLCVRPRPFCIWHSVRAESDRVARRKHGSVSTMAFVCGPPHAQI